VQLYLPHRSTVNPIDKMTPRPGLAAILLLVIFAGVRAELPVDNVIVAFNNAAQDDIRTAGVQNQISAKVREPRSGARRMSSFASTIACPARTPPF